MNRPIALLSDFGLKDHYVGSIKSVILKINPKAIIFDITHEVRPQNIREAAFLLYSVSPVLPKGTIVVAVVDPGVGSMRQALCIKTNKGFFIGPNNGIFSMVLNNEDHFEARVLANDRYFHVFEYGHSIYKCICTLHKLLPHPSINNYFKYTEMKFVLWQN